MRGQQERSESEVLESQVIRMRVFARRLWFALKARTGLEAEALFGAGEELRAADPVFDAVETVFDRHSISIVPCRTLADRRDFPSYGAGPPAIEMYLGRWPDGTSRNLTREQVLMMGGQDPEAAS